MSSWIFVGIYLGAMNVVLWTMIASQSWAQLASRGRLVIFLNGDHLTNITTWAGLSSLDQFFAIFHLSTTFSLAISNYLSFGIAPCLVITVWLASLNFANYVQSATKLNSESKKMGSEQWSQIYVRYQIMRKLCQLVNNIFGLILSSFAAYAMLSFAVTLDSIVITENTGMLLQNAICQIAAIITLVLAADVSNQVY